MTGRPGLWREKDATRGRVRRHARYSAGTGADGTRTGQASSKTRRSGVEFDHYTIATSLYRQLLSEHPESDEFAYKVSNTVSYVVDWHLRRKAEPDNRAALELIDGEMLRLKAITDPAVTHDATALLERLQTNRALAVKRLGS